MTNQTKIEWTDFTVNFWEGCQKVGPGCDFCYAEARNVRFRGDNWGPGKPRRKVKGGIAKLRKINRGAKAFHAKHGRWPRVFCSSLSDIFDNAVPDEWRVEAFNEIELARDCRIQLLTKRVGNVEKMARDIWDCGRWPQHVGLMITVVNQAEADRDIPKLLDLKARLGIPWVGLSMEPLLGPVDLEKIGNRHSIRTVFPDVVALEEDHMRPEPISGFQINAIGTPHPGQGVCYYQTPNHLGGFSVGSQRWPHLDWVIVGGESGPHARPMHPDWVRSLRDQCAAAGTPFLFKQWGEWVQAYYTVCPDSDMSRNKAVWLGWDGNQAKPSHNGLEDPIGVIRIGKKRAGRLLDGVEHNGFPGALT